MRVLPGAYLGRATPEGGEPRRSVTSASPWWPTPPQVERGLGAIRATLAPAISQEKVD